MSVRVSTLVWGRSKAKGHVLMLLLALADQANDDGYCWPKQSTLARRLRLGSDRAVRKAIDAAEQLGELSTIHRTNEGRFIGNAYQINLEVLRSQEDIWDAPPEPQFRPSTDHRNHSSATTGTTVPVTTGTTVPNNNRQLQPSRKPSTDGVSLPEWLPEEAWGDFLQHRKAVKAPVTPLAATRLIRTLTELREQGHDPVKVIDQTIATGKWTGLFPLSLQKGSAPAGGTARAGEAAKNPYQIKVTPVTEEDVDW